MNHHHHGLIRALVREIRELREVLARQVEETEEQAGKYRQRLNFANREAERTRETLFRRDNDCYNAVRDLERARERGDSYEEERALRRLRSL